MTDHDDVLFFDELRWRLSNINPNVPTATPQPLTDLTAETLLVADVVAVEAERDDWRQIAESYRELAQICIEAAARHYQTANRLTRENRALRALL